MITSKVINLRLETERSNNKQIRMRPNNSNKESDKQTVMQKVAQHQSQKSIGKIYDESRSRKSRRGKNCEKQKIPECIWNKRAKT